MPEDRKLLSLEDLLQIQQELGPPDSGGPKGSDFNPWAYGSDRRPDPRLMVPRQRTAPQDNLWSKYQEGNPNPQMGFLKWLLSRLQGGMWGNPDQPDQIQDQWMQDQMKRPQLPKWRY